MELEHSLQQSGFLAAFQFVLVGSILALDVIRGTVLFQRFVRTIACYVISFGPMAVLIFMLYQVSQLSDREFLFQHESISQQNSAGNNPSARGEKDEHRFSL